MNKLKLNSNLEKGDLVILDSCNIIRAKKIPILLSNNRQNIITSISKNKFIYYIDNDRILQKYQQLQII